MNFHKPYNPDLQSTAGLPAREVIRAPYTLEPYCPLSIELLMAWNSIQRFRVKDRNKVKSGTYVSMRPTHALNNVTCQIFVLAGYSSRSKYGSIRFTKSKSRCLAEPLNTNHWRKGARQLQIDEMWHAPKDPPANMTTKKFRKKTLGGANISSLISIISSTGESSGNVFFRFNAKVLAFADMLQRATRYEQHTVLTGINHNVFDYSRYHSDVAADKQYSDQMHAEMMADTMSNTDVWSVAAEQTY